MLPFPFPNACVGNGDNTAATGTGTGHGRHLSAAGTSPSTVAHYTTSGCAVGYEGPLCGVCLGNYYFDHTKQACLSCVGQGQLQLSMTIIPPLIVLLAVLGVILFFPDMFKEKSRVSPNDGDGREGGDNEGPLPASASPPTPSTSTKMIGWINRISSSDRTKKLMSKLKILISVYQIIFSFPFALILEFPASTGVFFHVFSSVNLSATTFGSPACYVTSFDYFYRLLLTTLTPIVIFSLVIFVFFPIHLWYYRLIVTDNTVLIGRYFSCVLLLAYLFLPNVTTTTFGTFNCTNIDPEGLVPGTPTYLRNDYSISCKSSRYSQMNAWAIAMIFVYPVGFTSIIFLLLYRARKVIMTPEEAAAGAQSDERPSSTRAVSGNDPLDEDNSPRASDDSTGVFDVETLRDEFDSAVTAPALVQPHIFADEIRFLYEDYKPEYWYWEVGTVHVFN